MLILRLSRSQTPGPRTFFSRRARAWTPSGPAVKPHPKFYPWIWQHDNNWQQINLNPSLSLRNLKWILADDVEYRTSSTRVTRYPGQKLVEWPAQASTDIRLNFPFIDGFQILCRENEILYWFSTSWGNEIEGDSKSKIIIRGTQMEVNNSFATANTWASKM